MTQMPIVLFHAHPIESFATGTPSGEPLGVRIESTGIGLVGNHRKPQFEIVAQFYNIRSLRPGGNM